MKKNSIYLLLASLMPFASATAVEFPTNRPQPVSQYGLIQNVQDYSTNPFWSPDSPYNQRMPSPVYVQGTDLTAADCQGVVASLVATQCAARNNCNGVQLGTIRPAILTQLSQIPGHNYVSSCAGFLDGAFNDYVAQYGSSLSGNAKFPTAIAPGSNAAAPEFKIENPYTVKLPTWNNEPWLGNIVERSIELETLQAQNAGGAPKLVATQMPKTIADLSFEERMALAQEGYEPWAPVYSTNAKGERVCVKNCVYQSLNIETDENRRNRELAEAQHRQQIAQYQNVSSNNNNDDELAKRIAEALKASKK